MRSAQSQASKAYQTAANTGTQLGAEAQGIGANLTPFLTQEMLNPQGYSQQDRSAMLASDLAGAGGANAGLVGEANKEAATTRNAGGFQAALDDAARQRSKAAAMGSENIAAKNADLKQNQMQEGAAGLGKLYGTDTSGMLDAMGQESRDIDTEAQAGQSGWLQNTLSVIKALKSGGIPGMGSGGGGD